MSLARLSLPSISHVLERQGIAPKEAPVQRASLHDAHMGSAPAPSSSLAPQLNPMQTIDHRDRGPEMEEEHIFAVDRLANEAPPANAEPKPTVNDRRDQNEAALETKHGQALGSWVKNNFPRLVNVVRKLFPVKVAEVLLRRVGRALGNAVHPE
ncbi:hypothetical protein CPB84DRAFT_1762160 [Gymnopilus junonius]|uniref:Uncharacterized protein n=1 Tax=Gymnopilus junonius TaxID=109634 RepID=A0A9P5P214_GYMJU|nr:hypothetical protein CPB84DRAFT_1762160 [Gymnopilus junonius]